MKAYNLNKEETLQRIADYQQGVSDCDNGIRSKDNQSEDYYRGYGDQFKKEQNLTHIWEK